MCGDGKEKCLPLPEDGAVEARTVNGSKNKIWKALLDLRFSFFLSEEQW